MATARAGGEAEQPPPLRVATTLGEEDGGERDGAGPEPRTQNPSRPEAGAPRGGDERRLPWAGPRGGRWE